MPLLPHRGWPDTYGILPVAVCETRRVWATCYGQLTAARGVEGTTALMTVQEICLLMRRHLAALMIVVVVAAGVAYKFKRAPVTYSESGTVALSEGQSAGDPNPYNSFDQSMIDAAAVMVLLVMSPQGQAQVHAAGGSAAFDAALYNSYSLQFPDYSAPYIIVTATSPDPAQVHRTFTLVTTLLSRELAMRQAQAGVPAASLIVAHMIADSGPQPQPGSSKRSLLGIFILMIVAAFAVATFLDRHPIRARHLAGFRPGRQPESRRTAIPSA